MANLTGLVLDGNQLTGGIPPELGRLTNLEDLRIGDNQLTGAIPPEPGRLANLENLSIGDNRLTGAIPPELGRLARLRSRILAGNQLTGALARRLMNLSGLTNLAIQNTGLCAPADPMFQAWAANLPYFSSSGLTCEGLLVSFTPPDGGGGAPQPPVERLGELLHPGAGPPGLRDG